jgi:hypothetical protein
MKLTTPSAVVILILALVLLICIPFAAIWAVNTLFPAVTIPYSIETWIASVVLYSFFNTGTSYKSK